MTRPISASLHHPVAVSRRALGADAQLGERPLEPLDAPFGRLVVPGRQAIGCLMTILVGLIGAAGGLAIANAIDAAWLLTLLLQVGVAAVLVLITASATGRNE